jgi:hypothetical protein
LLDCGFQIFVRRCDNSNVNLYRGASTYSIDNLFFNGAQSLPWIEGNSPISSRKRSRPKQVQTFLPAIIGSGECTRS